MGVAGHFHLAEYVVDPYLEPGPHGVCLLVDGLAGDYLKASGPGNGGQGIAVEGPWMINAVGVVPLRVAPVGNHVDDFSLTAHGASGQSPGNDLGHGGEVGAYAVANLSAARRRPEPGYNFVEDKHHAVLGGQVSKSFQVAGSVEGQLAIVGAGWLQDQSGDIRVAVESVLHRVQVAGRNDNHALPTS